MAWRESAPHTMRERMFGFVRTFEMSHSMPRFSVWSVPTMATSGPASRSRLVARSRSVSVQTATGARYRRTM